MEKVDFVLVVEYHHSDTSSLLTAILLTEMRIVGLRPKTILVRGKARQEDLFSVEQQDNRLVMTPAVFAADTAERNARFMQNLLLGGTIRDVKAIILPVEPTDKPYEPEKPWGWLIQLVPDVVRYQTSVSPDGRHSWLRAVSATDFGASLPAR